MPEKSTLPSAVRGVGADFTAAFFRPAFAGAFSSWPTDAVVKIKKRAVKQLADAIPRVQLVLTRYLTVLAYGPEHV